MADPPAPNVNVAFVKKALRRAPFLVVAKTAPTNLPTYDVERDFRYYFFSDCMSSYSCLTRKFLRRGSHPNAKVLFPLPADYQQFFEDDVNVALNYRFPDIRDIVERWRRPGMDTMMHSRETAVCMKGHTYVLVTLAPFDDVELGITAFRARHLPQEISDPEDVPLRWFEGAFEHLPLPMAVVDPGGNFLRVNILMKPHAAFVGWGKAIATCLDRVKETRKCDSRKDAWEFSRVELQVEDGPTSESKKYRVWVWRPTTDRDLYAICVREHLATTALGLPDLVKEALG